MYFKTDIELIENKLTAHAIFSEKNLYTRYAYYLYCDDNVIQKQGYINQPKFTFEIKEKGKYYVRVFFKYKKEQADEYTKFAINTETKYYKSQDEIKEYEQYINSDRNFKFTKLPYTKLVEPKQDILIAVNRSHKYKDIYSSMIDLSKELDLKHTKISDDVIIITQNELCINDEKYVAFSGMGRTDTNLIVGMKDIKDCNLADDISGNIGNYCLMRGDKNSIIFETDFFGTGKIYYFYSNDVLLSSNRVHLLILAMKKLEINRIPNMTRIYASLSQHPFVRQNFCQELNIKGLIALRADSKLIIDLNTKAVKVEKTDLFYKLNQKIDYDDKTYKHLIKKACNEIIDNLRIALEYPSFEKYVLHITGGMDSRVVLCALSKLPKYRDKIIPRTKKMDTAIDEYRVAMKILSKYPLNFDKIERQDCIREYENRELSNLSILLGTTYGCPRISISINEKPYRNTCILPGYHGDYLMRNIYSAGKHNKIYVETAYSDNEFSNAIINNMKESSIFDASEQLNDIFIKECLQLPGRTNLEKIENLYLYYRNGLHFCTEFEFDPLAPDWSVLQSKSLLSLKLMVFPLNYDARLELDILYELNPEIASIEFSSKKYQSLRKKLNERHGGYYECTEYDENLINEMMKKWEKNNEYEKDNLQVPNNIHKRIYGMNDILDVLHEIIIRLNIKQDVGLALYNYVKNSSSQKEYRYLKIKLYSLYHELF